MTLKGYRLAAGAILAFVIAAAAVYLNIAYALWLAALAAISFVRPVAGISVLFFAISVDFAAPMAGGIFVSYSELQLAVCLAASTFAFKDLNGVDWRPLKWGLPFLAAVLISSMIQLPLYKVPFHLLRIAELFVAATLSVNLLVRSHLISENPPDLFKWSIAAAALFYSSTGLFQFLFLKESRIFSFFSNPNQFGGYLILLLPFCLVFFFAGAGRDRRVWGYLSFLTISASLLTLSRSALLATLISSALILAIQWKRMTWRLAVTAVRDFLRTHLMLIALHAVIVAGAIAWMAFSPTTQMLLADLRARNMGGILEAFKNSRWPYFVVGIEIWKDYLWTGVGPGRYQEVLVEYQDVIESFRGRITTFDYFVRWLPVHVHSLYLQLGVTFGIPGLAGFLCFVGSALAALLRRLRTSPWALAGTAMWIGFLIHNLLDVTFPSLALEVGMLLGASLAGCSSPEPPSETQ